MLEVKPGENAGGFGEMGIETANGARGSILDQDVGRLTRKRERSGGWCVGVAEKSKEVDEGTKQTVQGLVYVRLQNWSWHFGAHLALPRPSAITAREEGVQERC